jgi:prepilin-type N-terminal cleavage/methylation domain-containing protein
MKGLSLIEVLVSVSIFLILVAAVFLVMNIGSGAWFSGGTAAELRQQIIRAFMVMEKELKETSPAHCGLSSGTSSYSLVFELPEDVDQDGTILDSSGFVEFSGNSTTYALDGAGRITRTLSGVTTILANDINSLEFTRPDTPIDAIEIDITAEKKAGNGRVVQESGHIQVKMRN